MLETNLDEIDGSGKFYRGRERSLKIIFVYLVHRAAMARKQSFASANPLALGVGGVGPRNTGLQTPLGWLTGKLTGVGAR